MLYRIDPDSIVWDLRITLNRKITTFCNRLTVAWAIKEPQGCANVANDNTNQAVIEKECKSFSPSFHAPTAYRDCTNWD
jgi:hypothetical protein